MTYGIKVSNIGKDVKTCDDTDLVMSSEITTLKTFGSQTLSATNSYTHSLGYTPIYLFAVYESAKPLKLGFIGQNNSSNMTATTTTIDYDSMAGEDILVYVFYEEL